ncbi:MAG TPA: S8 family serine peptidase, partial [Nitriliruptorales bacterium]
MPATPSRAPRQHRAERGERVEGGLSGSFGVATCAPLPAATLWRIITTVALAVVVALSTFVTPAFADTATFTPTVSTATIGADLAWADGLTGAGVRVAVVDTGIAAHPDLDGRVVARLDLSGGQSGALDDHGHGTFVAGLVAGGGSHPVGVAPEAELIDVRIADDEGRTSLPQVLGALHALAVHHAELGTDVVLLALGSEWPGQRDPLDAALQRLWDLGIVVVVPAGNDGPDEGTVATPGRNPAAVTVGAVDDRGTADRADDEVPAWSSAGSTGADAPKPDLLAPGVSVVSLRNAGSDIDRAFPEARFGDDRFRGTGTSMSAAVAAGAVALLLDADPAMTPDEVKARLTAGAVPAPDGAPAAQVGHGVLDVPAALAAVPPATAAAAGSNRPAPRPGGVAPR